MAHGTTDWHGSTPQEQVYRSVDMAELAARLGSPDVSDRRGNVVFMDSFANGPAGWDFSGSGGVAAGYPVADPVYHGALALGLQTDAVNFAGSEWDRSVALPIFSKFGVETTFAFPINTQYVGLGLSIYTGAVWYSYAVRWYQNTGQLGVFNSGPGFTILASPGPLTNTGRTWYTLKLVIDPTTGYYERVLFNTTMYDCHTIQPPQTPDLTPLSGAIFLRAAPVGAVSRLILFDSVVFTVNE
jgi:hypothetical protein